MDKVILEAPQPKDPRIIERRAIGAGGGLLLALCVFFTWRELSLQPEVLAVVLAGLAAAAAIFARSKRVPYWGPIALAASTVLSGCWYAATKEPVLLVALGMSALAAIATLFRARERFDDQSHLNWSWLVAALSGVASSFGSYFLVFDATDSSLNQFIARRSLLTLSWLVSGTVMLLIGRKTERTEVSRAGVTVLALSMAKFLLYDLVQTEGIVRIGALAIGGLTLVGASWWLSRGSTPAEKEA